MFVKSYWYKVKRVYSGQFFPLCPPHNNLEANIKNRIGGLKHPLVVDKVDYATTIAPTLVPGKCGRPSRSSTTVEQHQPSLHSRRHNVSIIIKLLNNIGPININKANYNKYMSGCEGAHT